MNIGTHLYRKLSRDRSMITQTDLRMSSIRCLLHLQRGIGHMQNAICPCWFAPVIYYQYQVRKEKNFEYLVSYPISSVEIPVLNRYVLYIFVIDLSRGALERLTVDV